MSYNVKECVVCGDEFEHGYPEDEFECCCSIDCFMRL